MMRASLLIVIAVGVGVGLYVLNRPDDVTAQDAERMMLESATSDAQRELFGTLSALYPDEYQAFLQDMADLVNQTGPVSAGAAQRGFELAQNFTVKLRQDNAGYVATAPAAALTQVREINIEILQSMSDTPELCARFATLGGAGMTIADLDRVDMDLMVQTSMATFQALAAGRDTPVSHTPASKADINAVVTMWQQQPDVTPAYMDALVTPDFGNPATCAANLSFEKFVHEGSTPEVQRVGVYMMQAAAAGQ